VISELLERLSGRVPVGKSRSPKWGALRDRFLVGKVCAVCGGKEKLQAHHVLPFHLRPDLELEESNLLALCESKHLGINCHLLVGHLGDFRKFNRSVATSVDFIKAMLSK
jgi:5-methylcytosine-specific restriction protein A